MQETNFLKTLNANQIYELRGVAAELKELAEKLASFRLTEGDNHGCIEEASGFASAAGQSVEEMLYRAEARAPGRGRRVR